MIKLAAFALLLSACVAYAKLGNTLEQTTAQFGPPAESKPDYAVFLVDRYQRIIEIYNDKGIAAAVIYLNTHRSFTPEESRQFFNDNFPGLEPSGFKEMPVSKVRYGLQPLLNPVNFYDYSSAWGPSSLTFSEFRCHSLSGDGAGHYVYTGFIFRDHSDAEGRISSSDTLGTRIYLTEEGRILMDKRYKAPEAPKENWWDKIRRWLLG